MTSKKYILFVDDETAVLDGFQRMLRKLRHEWEMVFVASGAEALAKMAESRFDVIVTDLVMPDMSGVELLQQVVQRYPDTARIALSGRSDDRLTNAALEVAHQFLFKPADADAIKQAVSQVCTVQQIVRDAALKAAVVGCNGLPSPPGMYAELTKAAESETVGAKDIANIITHDIAMSAKLLQLVNSSFFGIARRVSSVEEAVALLGLTRIKALVLAQQVFKMFSPKAKRLGVYIMEIWNHSFSVATVSLLISKAEKQSGDRTEQAFASGLLHGIGKLLLLSSDADTFETIRDRWRREQKPFHVVGQLGLLQDSFN